MCLDSLPYEMRAGGENEIARHSLPDEMKVIVVVPHVLARAGDHVLLSRRVVRGGARMSRTANVVLRIEGAHRLRTQYRRSCEDAHEVGHDMMQMKDAHLLSASGSGQDRHRPQRDDKGRDSRQQRPKHQRQPERATVRGARRQRMNVRRQRQTECSHGDTNRHVPRCRHR